MPRLGLEYFRVGLHSSFALAPRHADLTAPPAFAVCVRRRLRHRGLALARGCQGSDQPPAEYRRPPRPLRWDHGTGRRPDEPSAPVGGPPTHRAGPVREQPPPHGPPRARTPLVAHPSSLVARLCGRLRRAPSSGEEPGVRRGRRDSARRAPDGGGGSERGLVGARCCYVRPLAPGHRRRQGGDGTAEHHRDFALS